MKLANYFKSKNNEIKSKNMYRSKLYDEEKKQMFTYINNFITKLSIDKGRLNDSGNNIMRFYQIKLLSLAHVQHLD